jgi:hypothetical protein
LAAVAPALAVSERTWSTLPVPVGGAYCRERERGRGRGRERKIKLFFPFLSVSSFCCSEYVCGMRSSIETLMEIQMVSHLSSQRTTEKRKERILKKKTVTKNSFKVTRRKNSGKPF